MEVILIFVGIFVVMVIIAVNKAKKQQEALAAYRASLTKLKQNPVDATIRQQTLHLGRVYSNLMRDSKGHTVFDEVALLNDINAASAGATSISQPIAVAPAISQNVQSHEDRLSRLSTLQNQGLISQEEYESKRSQIISEL